MKTNQLPNELECLAARLVNDSEDAVACVEQVPHLLAAAAGWSPEHETPDMVTDMVLGVRTLQFDAIRLAALVQAHDAALRRLYSLSLYAVDNLRMGQAGIDIGMSVCMETLADMQEVLQDLFPGDTCISS
jgi:hypothetical protein